MWPDLTKGRTEEVATKDDKLSDPRGTLDDPAARDLFDKLVAESPDVDRKFLAETVALAVKGQRSREALDDVEAQVAALEAAPTARPSVEADRPADDGSRTDQDAIHRRALARAQANTYSLNNPYLSRDQKAYVEAIYQLPIGVFSYIILIELSLDAPREYVNAFVQGAGFSALVAIYLWFRMSVKWAAVGGLFSGWVSTAVCIGFGIYLAYRGDWASVAISVAAAMGVLAIVSPSMWLYLVFSRELNPKYAIAKKLFGITFPFEADL